MSRHPLRPFVFLRRPAWLGLGLLLGLGSAQAQGPSDSTGVDSVVKLKPSARLREGVPASLVKDLPVFLFGDNVTGQVDFETILEGHAELRRGDTVIKADRLSYDQSQDRAQARGHVRVNRSGNVFVGPSLDLKVQAFEGHFDAPSFEFLRNKAYGESSRVDFIDDHRSVIHDATYTTCRREPGPNWLPDWILKATTLRVDTEIDEGVAEGAVLRFKGVPLLPVPSVSFPVGDQRKSGFLAPTLTPIDTISGPSVTQPYYWNIAPNRDATFFPTLMAKRGLDLGTEFRYLEPDYKGTLRGDYMPSDKLRGMDRWGASLVHTGTIVTGIGGMGLGLNLNRVSDDNYWRDFPRTTATLTQRLLPNDVSLGWGSGYLSTSLRAQSWQTLQDVSSPITPPYGRLPQLTARYVRSAWGDFDVSVIGDYTRFASERALTLQPNADRGYVQAEISRPWLAPGWFVTPKLQFNATRYNFDAPANDGSTSATRTLPTASLDSGLILERDASFFGRAFRQTLEPRAFYTATPWRDQSHIPLYDTAPNDINFATVYNENTFGGEDRIANSKRLTLGVTSRLFDPQTGAEAARFGVAERYRYAAENVTLPGGTPLGAHTSDLLLGAALQWDPRWSTDSTVQLDPKTLRSVRSTMLARYSPSNYRSVSFAYRLQKDLSEQVDLGWQWPLNDLWGDRGRDAGPGIGLGDGRWYSVGRLNYSLFDRQLVDAIVGLEYDAGCWIGRIVMQRLQQLGGTPSQSLMFQLEFSGLAQIGNNPLQALKLNVPRYQMLRETTSTPSRFSNYD